MTSYKLSRLAPGSYDVLLNGEIIAALVKHQSSGGRVTTWTAELLADLAPEKRPHPFTELEHQFATFDEVRVWLGNPIIEGEGPDSRLGVTS